MDSALFEQLLYEEESTALDFKKEQYRFARATDVEKSELLKDILGFCNAWRRCEAYILIGVEEIRGGRSNPVGIRASDHLDDHSLQQFVNNLANQPVDFHYEAFAFEGKQIGVLQIEEQTRPVYLKRDYGGLFKEKVYVRRGSSTDPTKPASLEEIAQMRVDSRHPSADLAVEFADVARDGSRGTRISWEAEYCTMPASDTIPDYSGPKQERNPLGIYLPDLSLDITNIPNRDYFRELAEYEFTRRLFRPVRLILRNVGHVAATNVRAELRIPVNPSSHSG